MAPEGWPIRGGDGIIGKRCAVNGGAAEGGAERVVDGGQAGEISLFHGVSRHSPVKGGAVVLDASQAKNQKTLLRVSMKWGT